MADIVSVSWQQIRLLTRLGTDAAIIRVAMTRVAVGHRGRQLCCWNRDPALGATEAEYEQDLDATQSTYNTPEDLTPRPSETQT